MGRGGGAPRGGKQPGGDRPGGDRPGGEPAAPSLAAWAGFMAAFLGFSAVAGLWAAAAARWVQPAMAYALGFAGAYALFALGASLVAQRRPGFRWARWATAVALFSVICFGLAAVLR